MRLHRTTGIGETIRQDIRFALRTARHSPAFVLTAIGTLALGIGAITSIFSILSGVLLRPLPFSHPDRLVQLDQVDPRNGGGAVFSFDLETFRQQSGVFDAAIGYGNVSKNLLDVPDPERIQTVRAEPGLFRMLGAPPLIGRTFQEDDPLDVVVLSASLWKRRFSADPSAIGRKVTLDHDPYTVIGVMPETFQFPYRNSLTEMWIPWAMPPAQSANRNSRVDFVTARLKPGVTMDRARHELAVISGRLAAQYPDNHTGRTTRITPLSDVVAGPVRSALLTLLGAVGLVLFIACANVANLLLARAARRSHEIAVRAALGASRSRLVQQLLTESVLLSMAGGLAGLLIATIGTRLILDLASSQIPRSWEIGLDWRVFCFLLAANVVTGIAFGILPALTASRVSPETALKEAGERRSVGSGLGGWSGRCLRDGLVVAEITLSFVLLVSAGLLLRVFQRLQETPAGFVADHVLTLRVTAALSDYSAPGSYGRYLQELEDHVRGVPGVRAAGFIQYLPLQNWGWSGVFSIAGRTPQAEGQQPQAELRYISPGYFEALRIPIRSGRAFNDRDTAGSPRVILINEALAHRYFPDEDPVGRQTDRGVIVGVAGDVHTSRLDRPPVPEIYYSFGQNPAATSNAGVSLVVCTKIQPESMAKAITSAIHQVNPRQVIYDVKTMERVTANSLADIHLYLWLLGLFASLALLLAVSGVYGVISYVVTARTQEFGIRVALGAEGAHILRLVLGHCSWLVACGILLGTAGARAVARLLESLIGGGTSADPATLAAVALLLSTVALAAALAPARRAMRVDPVMALK